MTRETKIGLLVGLAFIIVIGILLSDQLMRSTEPPPAQLSSVGDTLRRGTTTPVSSHRAAPPAVSAQDASPENTVPTREEITQRPPPVTFVEIRPGGESSAVNRGNSLPNAGQPVRPGPVVPDNGARNPSGVRTIADIAADQGETLIGPDGQPLRATRPIGAVAGVDPNRAVAPVKPGAPAGMKQYTVQPGDSLSKIAQTQMGSASKANRDAIVKANPSLAADPNKVIIGVTYNIPMVAATPAVVANPGVPATPVRPATPVAPAKPVESVYVVQAGDNLTRIAKEQVGDAAAVAAIKELNKDVVKNWDLLQVGTKLRMPGRSVASAQ